ncbi:MAG: DeoR/GlpR family DNA-binding transcription regulator [Planctomycetota bacterium]|jgi:DeoR/GlpR family transcriptional regulator of sugar metabolism
MVKLQEDRHRIILDLLEKDNGVIISSIAGELNVSEMTIRRDLVILEEKGLLKRVHGGAVAVEQARFGQRLTEQKPGKIKATSKLLSYLPESGTIYLDGSTTMLNLVDKLTRSKNIQVATNNVETFHKLSNINGVDPLLIGGKLDRRTDNMVGSLAMRSILAIAFDAAFFSSWGIAPDLGLMEVTLEDAEVKDLVASRSKSVYLAIDESKLGRTASGAWRPDREKTVLSTNLNSNDQRLKPYKNIFSEIL